MPNGGGGAVEEGVRAAAQLMAVAARTAPKTMGSDVLEVLVITGEEKARLAAEMRRLDAAGRRNYGRDARGVDAAHAVVLIGLNDHKGVGLDCGACGYGSCAAFDAASLAKDFAGPNCALRLLDLGIALGSAAKTASILNVDNRVMVRIGVAARSAGLTAARVCCGIPLSATGKSPFFDRPP